MGDVELHGEGQQIVAASWEQHRGELVDEAVALVGVEQVVEPGIDDGAELSFQKGRPEGVGDLEVQEAGDLGRQ